MRTLELFCGTKSFSKVAKELGHQTITVDNDIKHKPDILKDIRLLSPYLDGVNPCNILWASPPCTCFSVASISTHWTGGYRAYQPKTIEAKISVAIIEKTLELIECLEPEYWFIENPRGVLRKLPIMNGLHRKTVTYCQYGDTRMKPTDIWTNFEAWKPRPMCKNGDKCHESAPRGSRTGTQGLKGSVDRSRIPPALFYEIFEQIGD